MTAAHDLKTVAYCWDATAAGLKPFEVRRDDRGYQRGDTLLLRKLAGDLLRPDPSVPVFDARPALGYRKTLKQRDARTISARVAWILTGGQFGIEPGYVVLGLADVEVQE